MASVNILDWLRLFATYTCVYLETHPFEAPSMVSIWSRYWIFTGVTVDLHGYAEAFRRQRAVATTATATATMPWHVTDWKLAFNAIHTDTLQPPVPCTQHRNRQPRGVSGFCEYTRLAAVVCHLHVCVFRNASVRSAIDGLMVNVK